MNTGIFANESAQDTLEYVAIGMIAILIGVAVLPVLRQLATDKSNEIRGAWPGPG